MCSPAIVTPDLIGGPWAEMSKTYHVYILTNQKRGTFYVGMTNDLPRRIYEHREKLIPGFTKKYNLTRLVYCEEHGDVNEAIAREKRLKRWDRKWKIELIEKHNLDWRDLYFHLNR